MPNKLFLYGHYEIQPSEINDRPYFKKGNYGLWWSYGYWIIGSDVMKGEPTGIAFSETDECPHQFTGYKTNWYFWQQTYHELSNPTPSKPNGGFIYASSIQLYRAPT